MSRLKLLRKNLDKSPKNRVHCLRQQGNIVQTRAKLEKISVKTTLDPDEAAEFLNITTEHLADLTKRGQIRIWNHKGRNYYLGGELDVLKYSLRNSPTSH